MKFASSLLVAMFAVSASAHFTLDYPEARGEFDEDTESDFCGGQDTIGTRDQFPLSDGFISIDSHHESWTAGVFLSTKANPTSFDDFDQIVPYFKLTGEGTFCIPLDLTSTNASDLTTNENVTIQVQFDGGDGALYQCADLTLSDSFKITETCTNATGSATSSSSSSSSSGSSTSTSPSSTASSTDSDAAMSLTSFEGLGLFLVTMGVLTLL